MSQTDDFSYVGGELGLFAHALHWKKYWSSKVLPFCQGDVLEVGAGLGVNTELLRPSVTGQWTCLEPDRDLVRQLESRLSAAGVKQSCRIVTGTLADLSKDETFDTILYIDVLEHIQADQEELNRASKRLRPDGRIVVLSPAHQGLFSEFDRSIGHFRRYSKKGLRAATPPSLSLVRCFYLDSCGLLASFANRIFLKQSLPSLKQVHFWDRALVPASQIVDRLFLFQVGKSIVGVWKSVERVERT